MSLKWIAISLFSILFAVAGCAPATAKPAIQLMEQTFDFSEFQEFVRGTGSISLYGYNPRPGIEYANIRLTPNGQMVYTAVVSSETTHEICTSDGTYCTERIVRERWEYPKRQLTSEEQMRVKETFARVTVSGWDDGKMAQCDPMTFYVYDWDGRQFTDVFCWKNELTQETQQRIQDLLESLLKGEPILTENPPPDLSR